MGREKSGTPLGQELLDRARTFWARNGRNSAKTAREFEISEPTIARYRDEQDWVTWADELDERTAEEALVRAAKENGKIAAAIGTDKVRAALKTARVHGVSIGELAGSLDKFTKVHQLLTGGATERVSVESLDRQFDRLDDDGKRKFIADLDRQAEQDAGESVSGSDDSDGADRTALE